MLTSDKRTIENVGYRSASPAVGKDLLTLENGIDSLSLKFSKE
jgi:hypothetical protein